MDANQEILHLSNDLDNLIDRYRDEYDVSYAAVVGMLHMKIHTLCQEAAGRRDELGEQGQSKD